MVVTSLVARLFKGEKAKGLVPTDCACVFRIRVIIFFP